MIYSDSALVGLQKGFIDQGGPSLLMPLSLASDEQPETAAQRVIDEYTLQLGAIPINNGRPLIVPPKYFYERKK